MVITHEEVLIRLLIITVLTMLIGMEREYRNKPAGLRTNVMVGIGSTLMTIASIKALELFPESKTVDPTRIAAQIITGIGFIGAGAILRTESKSGVVGLTTAATLWVVSGLGIAVGMGMYYEAVLATGFVFLTFFVISRFVYTIRKWATANPPKELLEERLPHSGTREH
ncbi:MgtC/SapB family protein [Candidatus Uhrbacteria bacterium]|nr:MgtC/SapB family protein [Candidatus Uhrbacteria bacterium]